MSHRAEARQSRALAAFCHCARNMVAWLLLQFACTPYKYEALGAHYDCTCMLWLNQFAFVWRPALLDNLPCPTYLDRQSCVSACPRRYDVPGGHERFHRFKAQPAAMGWPRQRRMVGFCAITVHLLVLTRRCT